MVGRLPHQPLFIEARALWGKSRNKINPFGTYTDEFETERVLLQARLAGKLAYEATILTPSFTGTYTSDTQQAYTDSLGNLVPQQGVELVQIALALDFNTPIDLYGQAWDIGGGISGIYTSTQGTGTAASLYPAHDGGRARVHLSASHVFYNGSELVIGTFYDGIRSSGYQSHGVELGLKATF